MGPKRCPHRRFGVERVTRIVDREFRRGDGRLDVEDAAVAAVAAVPLVQQLLDHNHTFFFSRSGLFPLKITIQCFSFSSVQDPAIVRHRPRGRVFLFSHLIVSLEPKNANATDLEGDELLLVPIRRRLRRRGLETVPGSPKRNDDLINVHSRTNQPMHGFLMNESAQMNRNAQLRNWFEEKTRLVPQPFVFFISDLLSSIYFQRFVMSEIALTIRNDETAGIRFVL